VLIDLPKNIQTESAEVEYNDKIDARGYNVITDPDLAQVSRAVEFLANAETPIILAGGGVVTSNASDELMLLSDLLMAPVATTFMGKGAVPEGHPMAVGSIGMHGNPAANRLMTEADVLLAVGTRFSDRATANTDTFCAGAKKIHIDIDAAEIGKNIDVDIPIVGDAKASLRVIHDALLKKLRKKPGPAWAKRVKEVKEKLSPINNENSTDIVPKTLLIELRKLLPENAIVTTEVGQNQMWSALYFKALKPRTFISSGGLGTMGFGFPAALGAKVACPDRAVVDIAEIGRAHV
jgi:acetolactate synthase-1/2/3 large subunit